MQDFSRWYGRPRYKSVTGTGRTSTPPWACCMLKMAPQDKKQQSLRKCNSKMTFLSNQIEHVQIFLIKWRISWDANYKCHKILLKTFSCRSSRSTLYSFESLCVHFSSLRKIRRGHRNLLKTFLWKLTTIYIRRKGHRNLLKTFSC